jgi:hypothetical protein
MVANNWSSVGHQSAMLAPCAPVAAPMATRAYCRRQLLANAAHCPASPRSRVLACDLHGSRSQGQFWARFGFPLGTPALRPLSNLLRRLSRSPASSCSMMTSRAQSTAQRALMILNAKRCAG